MTRRAHPVFAFLYERMTGDADRGWQAEHRRALVAEVEGVVAEVGAGTGANFGHYRRARRVLAFEPDPAMARYAVPRAARARVPVHLAAAAADDLPLADGAVDAVVCSLVLCSVPDLEATIAECRRVLRPGGVLRVYEHVRSARALAARWQDAVVRPWGWAAAGCHPNRDTVGALRAAGFEVRVRPVRLPGPANTMTPHVLGEARAR